MSDFRKLDVWKVSFSLAKDIYQYSTDFPKFEYYGLRSQLTRAAVSISTNIAEGCGRLHTKELINFLSIARGSATEVVNLLMISEEIGYIEKEQSRKLQNQCILIIKMLSGTIKSLKNKKDKL